MPAIPEPSPAIHTQLLLTLSASLLDAQDEASILRAVMQAGCELLHADGCFFLPFDEFSQSLPPLEFGQTPPLEEGQLSQPAQRQRCKVCEVRRAGSACPLLSLKAGGGFINCVPLRARGREAGLFSFVFSSEPQWDKAAEWFLAEATRLAERALEAREREAFLRELPSYDLSQLSGADELRSLLPQIEYRAVLDERARLAREIHDGLAQTIAFLKIEVGRAETYLAEGETDKAACLLRNSSRTLSDAYLDARQAIENLRRIPDEHLEVWLHHVAEDFEVLSGLNVQAETKLERDFPPNVRIQLIRIVQEALTNIRKHAAASQVWIRAGEDGRDAVIEVADNGRGFSPSASMTAARFGLRGMRERAESIGAEFQVTSQPGRGTVVRLHIPLCVKVKP